MLKKVSNTRSTVFVCDYQVSKSEKNDNDDVVIIIITTVLCCCSKRCEIYETNTNHLFDRNIHKLFGMDLMYPHTYDASSIILLLENFVHSIWSTL